MPRCWRRSGPRSSCRPRWRSCSRRSRATRSPSPSPSGAPSAQPPARHGPTLGALLVNNLSWRWAFFINLPVGIVSLLLGRAVLPEGREAHPGRLPDPFGVVLLGGRCGAADLRARGDRLVGLGQHPLRSSPLLAGAAPARPVRPALQPRGQPRDPPRPVPDQQLPLGERGDGRLRRRVQLDVPRQHPVPHPGLALLDPHGRTRHLHRTGHRRRDRSSVRQAGRRGSASGSLVVPGGLVWATGGALLLAAGHVHARLPRRLPAGRRLHRPRRRSVPAPAVVGRRPGPARPTSSAPAPPSPRPSATSARRSASRSSSPSRRRRRAGTSSPASATSGGCSSSVARPCPSSPPG